MSEKSQVKAQNGGAIEQFGYEQELHRTLKLRHVVLYGVLFMVLIAPQSIFGEIQVASHGMTPLVYIVGFIAISFTALSYYRMSSRFPIAGSVYAYVQRGMNPHVGFIAGWLILMDYLFVPALLYTMVANWGVELIPGSPWYLWVVVFLIFNTFVNVRGIHMTASVDWVIFAVEILALIAFIVFISDAERRIPVQYAKRQVGRKMYGGQSSNLPMKVNMSGVLPVIFAQSIASLPITIWTFIGIPTQEENPISYAIYHAIDTQSIVYMVLYFMMIIGFSYFYSSIQFNPVEIANNLKKQGGFIPGFRPGKPTADFIKKVLNKITLFGAIYLAIVAISPLLIGKIVGNSALAIGGTSVIIVVGVALETVKALESQMLMRQYKGFLE